MRTVANSIQQKEPPIGPAQSAATIRRFGLLDALILIASLGPGIDETRFKVELALEFHRAAEGWPNWTVNDQILSWLLVISSSLKAFLYWIMLATLILRFRRPRPPVPRTMLLPGTVACFGPICAVLVDAIIAAWSRAMSPITLNLLTILPALFVLGAWAALYFAGQYSPERSWIDRLGRCLGVLWIVATTGVVCLLAERLK